MWFFHLTAASSPRFQQGKTCGVGKCFTPRAAAQEKTGLKKTVGGNVRRSVRAVVSARQQSRRMEERPKGPGGVRYRRLAASDEKARTWTRRTRASGTRKAEKGGKCEDRESTDYSLLVLPVCTMHPSCTRHDRCFPVSFSLLSICFFFFPFHVAAALVPRTFHVFVEYSSYEQIVTPLHPLLALYYYVNENILYGMV